MFFIPALLLVFKFFPTNDIFQKIAASVVFFIIIPFLYIRLILKKPLIFFGIQRGEYKEGLKWAGISLLIAGLFFLILARYTSFLNEYLIPENIVKNFNSFLFYELVIVLFLTFIYEFFFRGFVMFFCSTRVGYWSILVQLVAFFGLVWITNGSIWNLLPFLIFSPFAGLIAYKSRSIVYSGVAQFILIILLDASLVRMIK